MFFLQNLNRPISCQDRVPERHLIEFGERTMYQLINYDEPQYTFNQSRGPDY